MQIIHELLDCICYGKSLRYQNFGKVWTIEEWKSLQQAGKEELKGFIVRDLKKEQVC